MKKSLKIMYGLFALLIVTLTFSFLSPDSALGALGVVFAAPMVIGMIQTSDDAKQERAKLDDLMNAILTKSKSEKRSLSTEEREQLNEYRSQFEDLTKQIAELEADEKRALIMAGVEVRKQHQQKADKDIKRYSLQRAIQLKAQGKELDGVESEMHQEAINEARNLGKSVDGIGVPSIAFGHIFSRAMSATGQTSEALDQGGMSIMTQKEGLIMALRPKLELASLGVKTLGGLTGNVDLVKGTSVAAAWENEIEANAEGTIVTSKASFSPKRLGAYGLLSKQLLFQSEVNFQQIFIDDLLNAIAQAVESAAISGASGGSNPVGILSTSGIGSVVGGASGLAMAWDHLVALEREVAVDNALVGSLGYLTNAKVRAALKATKVDAGSGVFVWPVGASELNGYKVGISNLVPSNLTKVNGGTTITALSAAIFGDWSQMYLGQWSGLDLVIDPYTAATTGQIKVVANSWWDVFVKRPEAFAAMVDIIAS